MNNIYISCNIYSKKNPAVIGLGILDNNINEYLFIKNEVIPNNLLAIIGNKDIITDNSSLLLGFLEKNNVSIKNNIKDIFYINITYNILTKNPN